MTFLDMFDFASNSIIMPVVAFLTCIFVGYIIKPQALIEEMNIGLENPIVDQEITNWMVL